MRSRLSRSRLLRPASLLLAALLFACGALLVARTEVSAAPAPAAQAAVFPQAWFGRWRGTAQSLAPGAAPQSFTMELVVGPTERPERFTWTVVYDGAQGRQERRYTLVAVDAARGLYLVDEGNGIALPHTLLAGALYSQFEVGGSRITARNVLLGSGTADERILVELVSTVTADAQKTGGQGGTPEVLGWPVRALQSAALRRVDGPALPAGAPPSLLPAPAPAPSTGPAPGSGALPGGGFPPPAPAPGAPLPSR